MLIVRKGEVCVSSWNELVQSAGSSDQPNIKVPL